MDPIYRIITRLHCSLLDSLLDSSHTDTHFSFTYICPFFTDCPTWQSRSLRYTWRSYFWKSKNRAIGRVINHKNPTTRPFSVESNPHPWVSIGEPHLAMKGVATSQSSLRNSLVLCQNSTAPSSLGLCVLQCQRALLMHQSQLARIWLLKTCFLITGDISV